MSRIWVPKFKILEAQDPFVARPRVKGRYKLSVRKRDGVTVDRETPWFDNLILNQGLDQLANGGDFTACKVGTGNTAPDVTDTALAAQVASTSSRGSFTRSTNSSSPYELRSTLVYSFAQGAAEGNLAEVGIGSTLFSRALILDGMGNPTTFPVGSDEFLDVAYEFILYPPLSDSSGTVSITGVGSVDYVGRPAGIGSGSSWLLYAGGTFTGQIWSGAVFSGTIGANTGSPSGSSGSNSTRTNDSYTPGSYTRTASLHYALGAGNVGGINSATATWGNLASASAAERSLLSFQYSYDTTINKTAAHLLTLGYSLTWARA